MDGRTWALVLAVWAAACISPARTFSAGAPWVLGRTSAALIARAGDRVTAMPLRKLMPLSSAPAAMAAHAGGRGWGRTSLRSAVEPQVGEGGSPAKDLPAEQDPGPAATEEGGSEETGAHFGPVPEIGPSNSLGSSGTPDALLQLRQTFLATRNITVEQLAACFPYELDEFQMDALRGLVQQRSVVVSAPTGSGKTVCGEAAVYLGAAMGKRVLYTTPLKALSNQKFNDFCEQFGSERVGLLTGDVSVNRANASIIVLTTEVYRNMLYDVQDGSVSDVHSVILDEFHYMNDRDRGTVWEESVIYSPPSVLIVALSATMRNVKDIRDWFASVHGPTDLITSDFRPVPLKFKYLDSRGVCDLFDRETNKKGQPRLNRLLLPSAFAAGIDSAPRSYQSGRSRRGGGGGNQDKKSRQLDGGGGGTGETWGGNRMRRSEGGRREGDRRGSTVSRDFERGVGREEGGGRAAGRGAGGFRGGGATVPSFGFSVRQLAKRDLLPAIVFIFSRKGCDAAAEEVATQRVSLVTDEEKERIMVKLKEFALKHKEVASEDKMRLALRGIASHHAGQMPIWKALVEELFQQGLIKVVFATETLAAGINMPARTTVITSMSKRTGDGVVSLTANELRQMCGRAGRRGKDTVGHSVMMRSRWEAAPEAFTLVMQQADPLVSKFAPNYAMVLNLLMDRPVEECRSIVERSFGSFLASKKKTTLELAADANSQLREEVEAAQAIVEQVDSEELRVFQKLTERLRTEQRVARILQQQSNDNRKSMFEDMLPYSSAGTPVLLTYTNSNPLDQSSGVSADLEATVKGEPDSAIIIGPYDASQLFDATTPDLIVCLNQRNQLRIVTAADVLDVDTEAMPISLGEDLTAEGVIEALPSKRKWVKAGRAGTAFITPGSARTAEICAAIPSLQAPGTPPEVMAQQDRVRHVEALLVAHPIFARDDRKELLRAARFLADKAATGQLRALKKAEKSEQGQGQDEDVGQAWKEFQACMQCLSDFGYVKLGEDGQRNVTDVGKLIASINAENPLWVGSILLFSEELYDFGPHQLAAALSCVVSDMSRPDLYVSVQASDKVQDFAMTAMDMQSRVVSAQLARGITFDVPLDATMAGLVEAWALGTPWSTILGLTSLSEGDIIRLLRRVLDLLRQIPRLPYVPGTRGVDAELRLSARRALTIMDRFPVSDDVTYVITDDEGLADDETLALASDMSNQRDALLAASLEKQRGLSNELYDLLGDTSDWGINPEEDVFSASEGAEGTWVGPLGERMGAGSELNSGWGSSDDEILQNEDFMEEDEEADEEFLDADDAFIKSLGLGTAKEDLLGDFSL